MLAFNYTEQEAAAFLSKQEGENYYVELGKIYRASKLPPYTPHLIK